ncbi:MAG: FAD-binding oxidoreductase [Chloroflexi bacterium OHK40]
MRLTDLIAELRRALGPEAVVVEPDALRTYDADASMIVAHPPQVVALPADAAQAARAVALAVSAGLAVVPRGAGTGIAGGAVPVRGGLLLSTARMDRVEAIEPRSRRALVGSGVVNAELNARLAPLGLQFAPDPSSQRASTIGGNLATNAGGPHCLKYGVTTNHALAVELARADGSLIWTSDGTPDAAGYDLTGLVVGSEGTFGLVTRALVRLTPLPEANRVALALFPSVVAASAAVSRVIATGSLPTSLEVMDHNAIRAVNGAYALGLPEAEGTTLLIVEVDGVEDGLDEALEAILAICRAHGAFELRPARTPAEQARVWVARKSVAGAIGRLAPAYLLVDTVVPRTRLPLMMEQIERLRHEHAMEICNVFHAGDGNLHPLVLYNPRDPDQVRRAHAIAGAVLELSIAQGGVISGEHGVGLEKQEYLPLLLSRAELQIQAAVYAVFNPGDHFNPAKIFPSGSGPAQLAEERRARMRQGRMQQGDGPVGTQQAASPYEPVVAPETVEQLAAVVAACHRAGAAIVPTGGHRAPAAAAQPAVMLALRRLNRILTYEPDDLTIGVEAGMTLAELQAILAAHGQMLPLEVADPAHATLGALVACAAEGPRRLGYGTLRDWTLGLTVVEADGTVVRLGAQVVKNVTGYDLVKLFVGSHGTLGVITAVSLRMFPCPPASATAVLELPDRGAAFALLDDLAAARLLPTAADYLEGGALPAPRAAPALLCVRAEGLPAAVERHMRELVGLAARHGGAASEVRGEEETALWTAVVGRTAPAEAEDTACLKLCVPPAELGAALAEAQAEAQARAVTLVVTARGLSGVAYLRAAGPPVGLRGLFTELVRRRRHAHLFAGAPQVVAGLPVWGAPPPAAELMRALKRELDPYGTMNPGGGFAWVDPVALHT